MTRQSRSQRRKQHRALEARLAQPADEVRLVVEGDPRGKGRPRHGKGRTFTPDSTVRAEERIEGQWRDAGRPRLPDVPLDAHVELVLERPQSHWRVGGDLSAAGERAPVPVRKPDADNALKLVLDALNELAYKDDVQVADARVVRRWANAGELEHTLIVIRPLQLAAGLRAAA